MVTRFSAANRSTMISLGRGQALEPEPCWAARHGLRVVSRSWHCSRTTNPQLTSRHLAAQKVVVWKIKEAAQQLPQGFTWLYSPPLFDFIWAGLSHLLSKHFWSISNQKRWNHSPWRPVDQVSHISPDPADAWAEPSHSCFSNRDVLLQQCLQRSSPLLATVSHVETWQT